MSLGRGFCLHFVGSQSTLLPQIVSDFCLGFFVVFWSVVGCIEGRVSVVVWGIDICPGIHESLGHFDAAEGCRPVQRRPAVFVLGPGSKICPFPNEKGSNMTLIGQNGEV